MAPYLWKSEAAQPVALFMSKTSNTQHHCLRPRLSSDINHLDHSATCMRRIHGVLGQSLHLKSKILSKLGLP